MSTQQSRLFHQLKQPLRNSTLSPFVFNSFLEYQKQRRVPNGAEAR
jgi:hypothetical protein